MTEIEEVTAASYKRQEKAVYSDPLHVPSDMLVVTYNGQELFVLNKRLLDQQLCWNNLEAIKEVHWFRIMIMFLMNETDDIKELRELAQDVTECEFELQRLWGFPEDSKYHKFWNLPKCECPKIDNNDNYPIGYYVINLSCPLHGE